MGIFSGILGFHIWNTVAWNSVICGEGSTASAYLFTLAVHPAALKPMIPWRKLGLQDPNVEKGQGF